MGVETGNLTSIILRVLLYTNSGYYICMQVLALPVFYCLFQNIPAHMECKWKSSTGGYGGVASARAFTFARYLCYRVFINFANILAIY